MISFSDDTKQVILISMIFNIFTTVLTVMVPLKIFQILPTHIILKPLRVLGKLNLDWGEGIRNFVKRHPFYMQIALKVLNFKKRYSTLFNIHIFKELDFKGHSKDEGVARKVTECDVCLWGGVKLKQRVKSNL